MPDATQTCPRCGRIEPATADFCYCGFIFPKPGQRGSPLPTPAIPLVTPAAPWRGRNLIWQFGHASMAAPLVAFAVSCLGRPLASEGHASAVVLLIVVYTLPVFGLVAAIVALASTAKYGAKGLLLPGIVGLLLNSLVLAPMIFVLVHK